MAKDSALSTGFHRIPARAGVSPARLDAWADRAWTDGMQVDALRDLDTLAVRTRNTLYRITLITAHTCEVLVQGGRFFPEPTRAVVLGSSLGGAFLKLRGIYCGFSLELYSGGTRIVTSGVQSIRIVDDQTARAVQ